MLATLDDPTIRMHVSIFLGMSLVLLVLVIWFVGELAQAQADAAVLLKQISADTAVAEKEKEKVNVVVEEAVGVANVIAGKEAEVANDLALAKPAEDEAAAAVQSITRRT